MRMIAMVLVFLLAPAGSSLGKERKRLKAYAEILAGMKTKTRVLVARATSMMVNRNGKIHVKNKKALRGVCRSLGVRVVKHQRSMNMITNLILKWKKNGSIDLATVTAFGGYMKSHAGSIESAIGPLIRCRLASRGVRVYASIAWKKKSIFLTAARWTRKDRIRVRRALVSFGKNGAFKKVVMIDESGATKGTHRF